MKFHNRTDINTGEKPYSCDFCPRTFAQKGNAKIHQMRCLDLVSPRPIIENPKIDFFESSESTNNTFSVLKNKVSLSCKYCGATYEKKRELKKHEKLHSAEKSSIACNFCDKKFDKKRALRKHLKIDHAGEKIFGCNYCHKKYAKRKSLKNHENHCNSIEKPYDCNLCDEKFAKRISLKNHERMQHSAQRCVLPVSFPVDLLLWQ